MAEIGRQTIIFFLPLGMEALTSEFNPYTGSGNENEYYDRRQLYLNPQSFDIQDSKMIRKSLTKGGFLVQYWGEELSKITASGTTGSSGIEGINVLRSTYRHEQIHFRNILAKRQRDLAEKAKEAAAEAAANAQERTGLGGTLTNIADLATGGAFSQAVDGFGNAIDIITDPFSGSSSNYSGRKVFGSVPTLAALATGVDMFYQGEFFRGYFESFNTKETAESPGIFTYSFSFIVTRRTGERKNFMPWHRNPLDTDGGTRMADIPIVAKGLYPSVESLSFPIETSNDDAFTYKDENLLSDTGLGWAKSNFTEEVKVASETNEQGINRRAQSTKGS